VPFARRALFDDNREIRMLLERRGALGAIERMDLDEVVAGDPDRLPALGASLGEAEAESGAQEASC
jgi:hypothetical protein